MLGAIRRYRGRRAFLFALVVALSVVSAGTAWGKSNVHAPRTTAKHTAGKAKAKPTAKCRTVRRRRGRKIVRVRVCPRPAKNKNKAGPVRASQAKATSTVSKAGAGTAPSAPAPAAPAPAAVIGDSAAPASAWDRPALVNPTVVAISDANRDLKLDQTKDYILQCPSGPMPLTWALAVWGGHNVVLENCDIEITITNWAAQFKNQTGALWIHDVHFGGSSLSGGIQLQEPGATVVMRDVLFDTVYGSYQTNHAECVQTWSGPARLLIDGLTCSTTYQGLFLLPNQWDSTTLETVWDLRNIDVSATGAYAMWLGDVQPSNLGAIPLWNLQNVYVGGPGEPRDYDGTSDGDVAWNTVLPGAPPGGTFVHAAPNGASGVDEGVSPLAVSDEAP